MTVTRDATSHYCIPQSAAEWTALLAGSGLSNPTSAWNLNGAGVPLADLIGSNPFDNVNGSPSPTFQQPVPGWAQTGVEMPNEGNTTQYIFTTTQFASSTLFLVYVSAFVTAPRVLFYTNNFRAGYVTANGGTFEFGDSTQNAGAGQVGSVGGRGTTTWPVLILNDYTAGRTRLFAPSEVIVPTAGWSGVTNHLFIGGTGFGSGGPLGEYPYAAVWNGTPAEITDLQAAALLALLQNGPPSTFSSIAVTPATSTLVPGGVVDLDALATLTGGGTQDVTATAAWSSSNPTAVAVSPTGIVNAVGPGVATISATQSSVTGNATVTCVAYTAPEPTPTFAIVMRNAPSSGPNNIILTPGISASSSTTTSPMGTPVPAPTPNSPAPSDVSTVAGTTLAALQAGSTAYRYVVAIEGYPHLLTDGDPTKAVQAWSGTDWTSAIDGLFVELDNQQTLDPWEPFQGGGTCTLRVLPDVADTFGIDTHRQDSGAEALLTAPCNRYGTPQDRPSRLGTGGTQVVNVPWLVVDNGSGFTSGDVFVGTECIQVVAGGANLMLTQQRGKYSPFPSGNAATAHFAEHHRITTDPQGVLLNPTVSQLPRVWVGRWVGVWMHKVDGNGTLNANTNAQCVFSGKIASIADDPETSCTVVELEHVLDVLKDITVGRDMFSGSLTNGWFLQAFQNSGASNTVFQFTEYVLGTANANPLTVVMGAPANSNQVQQGYYSLEEICGFLNVWLAGEFTAGRITGSYTWASPVSSNVGPRTKCYWLIPNPAGSQVNCSWALSMDGGLFAYLGLDADTTFTGQGSMQTATMSGVTNQKFIFQGNSEPFRIVAFQITRGGAIQLNVENCIGTLVDQYALIPSINRPATSQGLTWGCFLVDEKYLMIASFTVASTVTTLTNCLVASYTIPGAVPGGTIDTFGTKVSTDTGASIAVRQVYILEATFRTLIKTLFYNTGSANYNSALYDNLGYGIGIGLPGYLLGAPFELSVDNQPGWLNATACIIDEPTKISDLLGSDMVLRHAFPMWRSDAGANGTGGLVLGRWQTPISANAVAALTEDNKAEPTGNQANHRSSTLLDSTWQKNIIKIDYNRDFTVSKDGTYQNTVILEDETAVDDAGGDSSPFTIEARNSYSQYLGTGAGIESLLPPFLAMLPFFSRPARKVTRSIDSRFYEGLHVGDIVIINDTFMRDPATGTRGVSGREALITRTRYNPGGRAPDGSVSQAAGEVDLMFTDLNRWGPYAPSAEINPSFVGSHFSGGYNALAQELALQPHACSETTEPEDWKSFAVGYVIRITELDPVTVAAPLTWQATILATFENMLVIDRALLGYDPARLYRVTFDHYSQINPLQEEVVFQATVTTGRIEGVALPFQLAATNEPNATSSNNDLAELVPTNMYGDGKAFDVGSERAIISTLNALIDSKTAHQSPTLNYISGRFGSPDVWALISVSPMFFGLDSLSSSVARLLTVAPLWEPKASDNGVRITLSVQMPREAIGTNGNQQADFVGIFDQKTWTETNAANFNLVQTGAPQVLSMVMKDSYGMAWLSIEVFGHTSAFGVAECREGVRKDQNLR